jgi:hypothetical protein
MAGDDAIGSATPQADRNPPHRSDDKPIDRVPVPVAFAFATVATMELLRRARGRVFLNSNLVGLAPS